MQFIMDIFGVDLTKYSDVTIYFVMGSIASIVFGIRLILAVFLGGDGGDFEIDGDGVPEAAGDGDGAFSLFSLLSITAFFMGTGWMGVACRKDWELNGPVSLLISVVFGVFMMLLASGLMFYVRRLGTHSQFDPKRAKGGTGKTYVTIPAKGEGRGRVEIDVDGRRKVMEAVSTGESIESFKAVKVIDVGDDGCLVVEPE